MFEPPDAPGVEVDDLVVVVVVVDPLALSEDLLLPLETLPPLDSLPSRLEPLPEELLFSRLEPLALVDERLSIPEPLALVDLRLSMPELLPALGWPLSRLEPSLDRLEGALDVSLEPRLPADPWLSTFALMLRPELESWDVSRPLAEDEAASPSDVAPSELHAPRATLEDQTITAQVTSSQPVRAMAEP